MGTYLAEDNSLTPRGSHQWRLEHLDEIKPTPCFAVPCGPAHYDGSNYRAGFIFGYVLLEYGEGGISHEGIFTDCLGGILSPGITPYTVNPDEAGYIELDVPIDAGRDERLDSRKADAGWEDEQSERNLAAQLRTLIACRMRPFALRYELNDDVRRVKFLLAHNGFTEYEVFALCADYDPIENEVSIYTLDGRELRRELVPKTYGGQFNEADSWRPLCPYPSIFANEDDPRSTGLDHQGNYGIFSYPVGVASFPVVCKVCENDRIYSDLGRLGYQNMMAAEYRYWWNIYNAQRGHLISPLSWWGFVADELDYREKSNLDLMRESWEGAIHGIIYVAGKIAIKSQMANRLCLVLVPRFPLCGDTHTISGGNYWEVERSHLYSSLDQVAEPRFGLGLMGRYWDSLILGPQGGAILDNIWWDDEEQFNRELLVKVKQIAPQWFGAAYYRGGLYSALLEFLRENEAELGGFDARIGLRELVLPVYHWGRMLRIGAIVSENIMEDLEARGDPELRRYHYENEELNVIPVPLFWQMVGLRWDVVRNTAVFRLLETRDVSWEPTRQLKYVL